NELMSAIASATGVKAGMEAALGIVREAVDATSASCWQLEPRNETRRLLAAQNHHREPRAPGPDSLGPAAYRLSNSVVGQVLTTRKRKVLPDLAALDPRRYPLISQSIRYGHRSMICIPVEQDGHVFAMNFMFRHPPEDIDAVADRIEALVSKMRPILRRKI